MLDLQNKLSAGAVLLTVLTYRRCLDAGFVYDDSRAIANNPTVIGEVSAFEILSHDFWGTPLTHNGSHKSYRPLVTSTFRINFLLHGLKPFGFHVVNMLTHCLNVHLLSSISYRISMNKIATIVSTLLWCVHPVNAEAVCSVVGRADLLATTCTLLALRTWSAMEESSVYSILRVIPFACIGLLCKETAICIMPLLIAYEIACKRRVFASTTTSTMRETHPDNTPETLRILSFSTLILIALRLLLINSHAPTFSRTDNPLPYIDNCLERSLTTLYVPFYAFKLLVLPVNLCFDHAIEAFGGPVNIGLNRLFVQLSAFYCIVICFFTYHLRGFSLFSRNATTKELSRSSSPQYDHNDNIVKANLVRKRYCAQEGDNSVVFCTLFGLLAYLPASNILLHVGFLVAERTLYLPAIPFCLLIGLGAESIVSNTTRKHQRRLIYVAFALTAVVLVIKTQQRVEVWQNEKTLYKSDLTCSPIKSNANLGLIYAREKNIEQAEKCYREALQRRSNMADVHYNLAILYQDTNRHEEALNSYTNAMRYRTLLANAYLNKGILLAQMGRIAEALETLMNCSTLSSEGLLDPHAQKTATTNCLYHIARIQAQQNQHIDAIRSYHKAIEQAPGRYANAPTLYNMLGESYFHVNNWTAAEFWYNQALHSKSNHLPALLTTAKLMEAKNNVTSAEGWYHNAVRAHSTNYVPYYHLGNFYLNRNLVNSVTSILTFFWDFECDLSKGASATTSCNRTEKALESLQTAYRLSNQSNVNVLLLYANALRLSKRHRDAERVYRRIIELDKENALAWAHLAALLHLQGRYEEALSTYHTALKLNPNDLTTKVNVQKLKRVMDRNAVIP